MISKRVRTHRGLLISSWFSSGKPPEAYFRRGGESGRAVTSDSSGTSGTPENIMNKNGPMVIHNGKFDHGISMVNNIVNNG